MQLALSKLQMLANEILHFHLEYDKMSLTMEQQEWDKPAQVPFHKFPSAGCTEQNIEPQTRASETDCHLPLFWQPFPSTLSVLGQLCWWSIVSLCQSHLRHCPSTHSVCLHCMQTHKESKERYCCLLAYWKNSLAS